ncbi:MAG: hypothetical protein H6Q74_1307 [Firmicutes bacterium]|nr:hypothetical protein [Bacillota bacterium]
MPGYFLRMPTLWMGGLTIIFVIIWFSAWVANAIYSTHFDLASLRDMYIWLMTQLNATHAINSIWNSPRGTSPDNH